MRALLGLLLLLAPASGLSLTADEPTRLTVSGPNPPDPAHAGENTTFQLSIQLESPAGEGPGASREVEVSLHAPEHTGCRLGQESVRLDPVTGQASVEIQCRALDPGTWPVTVVARSSPHEPGRYATNWTVKPDVLDGEVSIGDPANYRVPGNVTFQPQHLDQAEVTTSLDTDLIGSPLAFTHTVSHTADGTTQPIELLARHGPGTYAVTVTANGARVESWTTNRDVHVPQPPRTATATVNATIEAGAPTVSLTDDAVNEDAKTKYPGHKLVTELEASNTDEINVTVRRPVNNSTVAIGAGNLTVDDSPVRHTFSHDPLPAGQLVVRARAGNDTARRTADIQDASTSATAEGPDTVLGDGRAWTGNLTLEDANMGSTSMDPGPVFGLPDVSWTVFDGFQPAEGWNVSIGAFSGGAEGTAETSRIPWPSGTGNATVTDGEAKLPVTLEPPSAPEPGSYRLSIYDPSDDRIGGTSWSVEAPPEIELSAPAPTPGADWPVNATVANPVEGLEGRITVRVEGDTLTGNLTPGEPTRFELPSPLAEGANVTVTASADWPGRPATSQPDAQLEAQVSDLAPRLSVHPRLDGQAVPAPLPVHPAGNHTAAFPHRAVDPNGDPVNVTASLTGPSGDPGWPVEADPVPTVHVPDDARAGKYQTEITATEGDQSTTETVELAVAETVRLGLSGPDEITVAENRETRVNLTVHNLGSTPIADAQLHVATDLSVNATVEPDGAAVGPGEPFHVALEPGDQQVIEVELVPTGGSASGPIDFTIAGVVG